MLPLEEPASTSARTGAGVACCAGGGGCLFRYTAARQPDRRLGQCAIPAVGEPVCVGEGGSLLHGQVCCRRDSAPALLVRLSRRARRNGILARSALPPTRSGAVSPSRAGRTLVEGAPISLTGSKCRTAQLLPRRGNFGYGARRFKSVSRLMDALSHACQQ